MTTAVLSHPPAAEAAEVPASVPENGIPLRLFSVKEYHEMIEHGILRAEERLELLKGVIVEMTPIGGPHICCVNNLMEILCILSVQKRAKVSIQNSVIVGLDSQPQPDVVVLKRGEKQFREVPRAEDILLVIEVSDTTIKTDREHKIPIYAASGIPEAWIVDLNHKRVECYSEPMAGESRYAKMVIVSGAVTLRPLAFPDVEVALSELFE